MNSTNAQFSHIKDRDSCIYLLQEDRGRLRDDVIPRSKIGFTNRLDCTFKRFRLQIIRSASPEKLNLIHAIKVPSTSIAQKLERFLHKHFIHRKSFDYSDEWLDLSQDDISWICSLTYEKLKEALPPVTREQLETLEHAN